MTGKILKLFSEGKTYLWAVRHSQTQDLNPERIREIRKALAGDGIDLATLAALRQVEQTLSRFPYPSARRADHTQYYYIPVPAFNMEVFINVLLTEAGLEAGMELFPGRTDWQFGHREVQYCIGGDTNVDMILPDNQSVTRKIRVGDVVAVPNGANFITHSSEEGGKYGHAHIFLVNEPQVYYDVIGLFRLQSMGMVDPVPGGAAFPFSDITGRIEVKNWNELLEVHKDRERDLPTWLRNGWKRRKETRALDYAEGTKDVVVCSPDRGLNDFIEWGNGVRKCFINPLVAEHTAAVTDCRFPAGYKRLHMHKEIWMVLQGHAKIKQSIPPLHGEWLEMDLQVNDVMAAAGGAHFHVLEATDKFVVRRMAETCAHNCHYAMMELKLQQDKVAVNT